MGVVCHGDSPNEHTLEEVTVIEGRVIESAAGGHDTKTFRGKARCLWGDSAD